MLLAKSILPSSCAAAIASCAYWKNEMRTPHSLLSP